MSLVHAKFRIPIGIPQNSEFCRKLLQIRPEPRSAVPFFFIVISNKDMYLDLRSDTRIGWSFPEFHADAPAIILWHTSLMHA